MSLDERMLRLALWCADQELKARRGDPLPAKPPLRPWNAELVRALELEVAVSRSGHQNDDAAAESKTDKLISAREAAAALGISKRHVHRLAADLDGELVDERFYVFRSSALTDYAKGREDGRPSS